MDAADKDGGGGLGKLLDPVVEELGVDVPVGAGFGDVGAFVGIAAGLEAVLCGNEVVVEPEAAAEFAGLGGVVAVVADEPGAAAAAKWAGSFGHRAGSSRVRDRIARRGGWAT